MPKGILMAKAPKNALLGQVPPRFEEVDADHVTLRFKVDERDCRRWLGHSFKARVVAETWNDEIQAVRVDLPAEIATLCENAHPHITLSRRQGVPPKRSNALLEHPAHEETKDFELEMRVTFERFR